MLGNMNQESDRKTTFKMNPEFSKSYKNYTAHISVKKKVMGVKDKYFLKDFVHLDKFSMKN